MKKTRFIKNVVNNRYFPLFIFMCMMLLAHRFMYTNYGDDVTYTDRMKNMSLWDAVVYGYNYYKQVFCRYLYGTFYYFIRKFCNGLFWRPIIALCYPIIAYSIFKIFDYSEVSDKRKAMAISCGCVLFIPMYIMSETGWLSTSNVYVLPTAIVMLACIGLKKAYRMEKIKWYELVVFSILMYVGTGHEQISALICGLTIVLLARNIFVIHKVSFSHIVFFSISFIQAIRAATWPGNDIRRVREAAIFFPNYFSLDIVDKIYLAYIETMKTVFTVYPVPFTIVSVLLCIIIWKKYINKCYRLISLIPLVTMMLYGYRLPLLDNLSSYFYLTFEQTINGSNFYNIQQYVGLFVSIVFLTAIFICIYLTFDNSFKNIFYSMLLFGGLCTRYIMGLSASLYASGNRTYFELFVCVVILIYVLVFKLASLIDEKKSDYLYCITIGLAVISYINYLIFI